MCVTLPGRVVSVEDGAAVVDLVGRRSRAQTVLCPEVRSGDWVLVAVGMIVDRVSAAEARRIRALLEGATTAAEGAEAAEGGTRP